MPVLQQLATSTMYFYQQVVATLITTGASYDPTADTVQMSFQPQPSFGPPADPSSWSPAFWTTGPGSTYFATILVGPANGGLVLPVGSYVAVVKITDSPEIPALFGWGLQIV